MRAGHQASGSTPDSQKGIALVLTLMLLAVITAMVVEFAYGVYINTSFLHNWQTAKKLSLTAKSGVSLASKFITNLVQKVSYTYPGSVDMPPTNPFAVNAPDAQAHSAGKVAIRIEDENGKFNINKIVHPNDELNAEAYESFKKILGYLSLNEDIADMVADWIDRNEMPRLQGSERQVKNAPMDSIDELLLVPGVDRAVYDKLIPYITIYGSGRININAADVPVLMSLSGYIEEEIDEEMAGRIIDRREIKPFEDISLLRKVPGFEIIGIKLAAYITVKAEMFRVISTASSEDGIKRIIECVLDPSGRIKYWKET